MRDEITIPAVTAHFMIDAQTGYVRIDDFAEHTEEELTDALDDMQKQGHEAHSCSICAATPAASSIRRSAWSTCSCRAAR